MSSNARAGVSSSNAHPAAEPATQAGSTARIRPHCPARSARLPSTLET